MKLIAWNILWHFHGKCYRTSLEDFRGTFIAVSCSISVLRSPAESRGAFCRRWLLVGICFCRAMAEPEAWTRLCRLSQDGVEGRRPRLSTGSGMSLRRGTVGLGAAGRTGPEFHWTQLAGVLSTSLPSSSRERPWGKFSLLVQTGCYNPFILLRDFTCH